MSKLEDRWYRALGRLLRALPATPMLVLVAVIYAGGFALPLAAHWKTVSLVSYSLIGSMLAFFVLFGWLAVRLEDAERRRFVDWTTDLRLLDSREFEWFVGEIFRREGHEVEETGSQDQPDGNVDLVLRRNGKRVIVQCKRWQSWQVGVDGVTS